MVSSYSRAAGRFRLCAGLRVLQGLLGRPGAWDRILFHAFVLFLDHAGVGWKEYELFMVFSQIKGYENRDATRKWIGCFFELTSEAKYSEPSGSKIVGETLQFLNPT